MSTYKNTWGSACRGARRQRGFTLVELMVTVGIALFLLGGLVTIMQNVRQANFNQQALAQLQDQQRFAMTVLTDMIQQGGYYASGTAETPQSVFGSGGVFLSSGQAFYGTHTAPNAPDTMTVRLQTSGGDGVILCDGTTNAAAPGTDVLYINAFTVTPPAGNQPGQLMCSVNGNAAVPLANGVTNLQLYYGVNRVNPTVNYNVDTYLTGDQMNPGLPGGGDWMNISSVRVVLTFTNPLNPNGNVAGQPATISFERVVSVMARAGVHS